MNNVFFYKKLVRSNITYLLKLKNVNTEEKKMLRYASIFVYLLFLDIILIKIFSFVYIALHKIKLLSELKYIFNKFPFYVHFPFYACAFYYTYFMNLS